MERQRKCLVKKYDSDAFEEEHENSHARRCQRKASSLCFATESHILARSDYVGGARAKRTQCEKRARATALIQTQTRPHKVRK